MDESIVNSWNLYQTCINFDDDATSGFLEHNLILEILEVVTFLQISLSCALMFEISTCKFWLVSSALGINVQGASNAEINGMDRF